MAALSQLESELAAVPDQFNVEQADLMRRTQATVKVLRERLNDPAAEAISDNTLINVHSWLQQAATELNQARLQAAPSILSNGIMMSSIDAIAQNFGQFPISSPTQPLAPYLDEAQRRMESIQKLEYSAATNVRAAQDALTAELERAESSVSQELASIAEQRSKAEALLAALGGTATSKGYSETAEQERSAANTWRAITVGLGAATAILALVLFTLLHEPGWESLLRRTAVTAPFIVLALYAGRQAAEHRREERTARRLQLAFGSVGAYLSDLDPSRRAELKSQLSSQLFGGNASDTSPVTGYPSSAEIVQAAIEAAVSATRQR